MPSRRRPHASELTYHGSESGPPKVGEAPGERRIVAAHEGQIVGYLGSETMLPEGRRGRTYTGATGARKLSMAWVHKDYRRRGIAETMLALERFRTGYTPIGDTALSKQGSAWQKGMRVPKNPEGEVVGVPSQAFKGAEEGIQERQAHMLSEPQFDPVLVRAAAPYIAPTRRKRPEPEQLRLEGI